MDPRYITPFIKSIQNVFGTMLQLPVEVGQPALKKSTEPTHDVTGVIGMTGNVSGSVILGLPMDAATAIVALFCGEKLDPNEPDFADAVGELINMISGGAKAQFPARGAVSISIPSVIVGPGHTVARQTDVPCVLIPCTTDCGDFVIEISIRQEAAASAPASGAVTNA
jgi:chemotaxis protein CheX